METGNAPAANAAANIDAMTTTDARRRAGQRWDHAARQRLYVACLPALRRWALRRVASCGIHDADDLVQIALLRALRHLDEFEVRGSGSFLAYLRQIVLNEARREWRRQRQRGEAVEIDESVCIDQDPVIDALISQQRNLSYTRALRHLNHRQRAHLALRVEHGMTFDEISRQIGGSADGARMIVARAMRTMSIHLAAA